MTKEDIFTRMYFERLVPYEQAGLIQLIRSRGELLSEEYQEGGILVRAFVPRADYGKLC